MRGFLKPDVAIASEVSILSKNSLAITDFHAKKTQHVQLFENPLLGTPPFAIPRISPALVHIHLGGSVNVLSRRVYKCLPCVPAFPLKTRNACIFLNLAAVVYQTPSGAPSLGWLVTPTLMFYRMGLKHLVGFAVAIMEMSMSSRAGHAKRYRVCSLFLLLEKVCFWISGLFGQVRCLKRSITIGMFRTAHHNFNSGE